MILSVGQRWEFTNSDGLRYVSEVMEIIPNIKMKVIQIFQFGNWKGNRAVNDIFIPTCLKIDSGVNVIQTQNEDGGCRYAYLYGQDAPNK